MTTVQVNLSDSLKEFVVAQVAAGGYQSEGEYLQALLREAQKRQAWEKVEAMVVDGLKSGEPREVTAEFWEQKKRSLSERFPETNNPSTNRDRN